ncbi:uncharacterized protein LOC142357818 [Convolutriloba macropyga]|uniref:uncharacterized protein LOC142357818 n=1 Tax=Convolutriloba macropyga TaxID=536237 RepID=UPI003F5268CE
MAAAVSSLRWLFGPLLLLAALSTAGATETEGDALCQAGNGLPGGFQPLPTGLTAAELDFDVKAALYIAWGQAGIKEMPQVLNAACGNGKTPTLGQPELLGACQQVVAGTNYKLHFTSRLLCEGNGLEATGGSHVGAVDSVAVVYIPLPVMTMGSGAQPSVSAQTITFSDMGGAVVA